MARQIFFFFGPLLKSFPITGLDDDYMFRPCLAIFWS